MDPIADQMLAIEWQYGDKDPTAHAVLKDRIEKAGEQRRLLSYSGLVHGVTFRLPNLMGGAPHTIIPSEWTGLDRRIIGDFLGHISMETYTEHGFMASALVVSGLDSTPSKHFFDWMKELGLIKTGQDDEVLAFWADQVRTAHAFYVRKRLQSSRR